MSGSILEAKAELRRQLKEEGTRHSAEERQIASDAIRSSLMQWTRWKHASSVLIFHPLPDEPDLIPLVKESLVLGRTVALPAFDVATQSYVALQIRDFDTDLVSGRFGVKEPRAGCPCVPINRLDFALVPGVGFDLMGGRLGRGRGYYDRLLAGVDANKCGVGFDWQVRVAIPLESHDIRLEFLVTQSRLLNVLCGGVELE